MGIATPACGAGAGFPCANAGDAKAAASVIAAAAKLSREAKVDVFMGLKSCSCAEPNDPGLVIRLFDDGHGEVDLY
ncbi:MAG TPA: hypothetical protein VKB71_03940, partial [Rhizomicrobium sp.]|nr:hypothetical protein [Rhizomicrobium sp.]